MSIIPNLVTQLRQEITGSNADPLTLEALHKVVADELERQAGEATRLEAALLEIANLRLVHSNRQDPQYLEGLRAGLATAADFARKATEHT